MRTARLATMIGRGAVLAGVVLWGTLAWAEGGQNGPSNKPHDGSKRMAPTTQPDGRPFGERAERMREMWQDLLKEINLTDDQKAKIHAIRDEARQQFQDWRTKHEDQIKELTAQMKSAHEAKDREKVQQLREKAQELWSTAPKIKDAIDKVRAVLTDEQRKIFNAKLEEKKKEFEERHPMMGGGEGGPGRRHDKHDGDKKPAEEKK